VWIVRNRGQSQGRSSGTPILQLLVLVVAAMGLAVIPVGWFSFTAILLAYLVAVLPVNAAMRCRRRTGAQPPAFSRRQAAALH